MKKIIVVQSIPLALELIMTSIEEAFPNLNGYVLYEGEFEKALEIIPKDGEVVVIASDAYHDKRDILFRDFEKDGDRIAEEIKKINPRARVYIFSTYTPKRTSRSIDGYFQKKFKGDDVFAEIVEIFKKLGLNNP